MLASLLMWLPSWVTGSIEPKAKREVRKWTRDNPTLRTLRYGLLRRFLLWGSDHPLKFSICIGFITTIPAYFVLTKDWGFFTKLVSPILSEHFDLAAYTGVQWGVQATLVALVYPIVVSFIALMLQRKAHSMVALRVYVLDSAVLPAGVSSIFLLLALAIQYFIAPYCSNGCQDQYITALLVMNSCWFTINLFLTGFFLSRTIRFIQEEEQLHAYTRVAVNIILRAELTAALKQHIYVNIPYTEWGFSTEEINSDVNPNVRMFSIGRDNPVITKDLNGCQELYDVHLNILKIVVKTWYKRAKNQINNKERSAPIICFPASVGLSTTGEIILCSIENGPSLNLFERLLVKAAFCFRPARQERMSLTTKRMLEEIGSEIEDSAEQHRFSSADIGLQNMIKLHKTLLLASTSNSKGSSESLATIGTSAYGWGDTSFDIEWLKPYREIGHIAVSFLDENSRIFNKLAAVPANIASNLPPKPEKLIIDLMIVGTSLAYQLGSWWTRKAGASLTPGATFFSGELPAPLNKVYEQAIVTFIGSWGHLRIPIPKSDSANEYEVWSALTARTLVYAKHIDHSAELFLKAVSRGDEVASKWFLESYMKWWGNHNYELEYTESDTYELRRVTLTLAEKTLDEAKQVLWDGETKVTVEQARKALNLAIHRYWESMRFYLAFLLIHNADLTKGPECRELRFAGALIKGTTQFSGGSAEFLPINNVDTILTNILNLQYGVNTVIGRLDAFSENLRWDNEDTMVSGWIYGWSGNRNEFYSMKSEQAILLVALVASNRRSYYKRHKLIDYWWNDLEKLENVGRYCMDLRKVVLSTSFNNLAPKVIALQEHLQTKQPIRFARLSVARTIKSLHKLAIHERITTLRAISVDENKINLLANQAFKIAFDSIQKNSVFGVTLEFIAGLKTEKQSNSFELDKEIFLTTRPIKDNEHLVENIAASIQNHVLTWNFRKRVNESGIFPVNNAGLRDRYDANGVECQSFLTKIVEMCDTLRLAGNEPVVLVGHSAPNSFLQLYKWGDSPWQHPLPNAITIRKGALERGESAARYINETPIYDFPTPDGDCFVVPLAFINTLELAGSDLSSTVRVSHNQISDERIRIEISWMARFRN